jgi:hypothetical protein
MSLYPHDLCFDLKEGDRVRAAVLAAAAALDLATSTNGSLVYVTVTSPQQTYRFGQRTADFLDGDPAPRPVKVQQPSTDKDS